MLTLQKCQQDGRAWQYFLRKLLNQISVERLIFCKSGTSSSESCAKQWSYCTVNATFSCNRWTAMWFVSPPKKTSQTKEPYFDWFCLKCCHLKSAKSEFFAHMIFGTWKLLKTCVTILVTPPCLFFFFFQKIFYIIG